VQKVEEELEMDVKVLREAIENNREAVSSKM
jgi:hypothetical protein